MREVAVVLGKLADDVGGKIAASKRKGLWMGGVPPLGYDIPADPKSRVLVCNEAEASNVRTLFELFDRLGTLRAVEEEACSLGIFTKRSTFRSGRVQGGNRLCRSHIHRILTNPIYLGLIRHRDQSWPAHHPAIVAQDLWDRVQARLQAEAPKRRGRRHGKTGDAPLTGKLRDQTGDRITPTHTNRHGRRFRYYVSNRLIAGGQDPSGWRLSAGRLEATIAALVAGTLEEAQRQHRLLAVPDVRAGEALAGPVRDLAARLRKADEDLLGLLMVSGTLAPDRIALTLDPVELGIALGVSENDLAGDLCEISSALTLRRRGVETRIIVGAIAPDPDQVLLRALAASHAWVNSLRRGTSLEEIADQVGVHESHIRKRAPLAFLSPRIQTAIRAGTQPVELTLEAILQQPLPLDWSEQERRLGF